VVPKAWSCESTLPAGAETWSFVLHFFCATATKSDSKTQKSLGDLLRAFIPFFKMYTVYINRYPPPPSTPTRHDATRHRHRHNMRQSSC
jgi:hypothetical protein